MSEINGLKCFCKCLAAILFSTSLENIHRSLHSISATFHIRRKIKGWAREGKFRASFERLKEEGSSKFSSKIRPLGKLNIPAIPFDPCLDGDGLENPQIFRRHKFLTESVEERLFFSQTHHHRCSRKSPPAGFHFPSSRNKFRCRPPARKRRTGQGKSGSALLRPVSRGPHEHGRRGGDMGVPSHGRRDEGRHSWCSRRPHSGEH